MTRRLKDSSLYAACVLATVTLASSARADTYNFVFDKPREASQAASPAPPSAPPSNEPEPPTNFDASRRWGLDLGAFYGGRGSDSLRGGGALVGPTFAASRAILLHAYLGQTALGTDVARRTFGGFETDILPLHAALAPSSAGPARVLDFGALAGFGTFEKVGDQPGSFYVGAAARARLTEKIFATAGLRANLGFALGELGVGLRL